MASAPQPQPSNVDVIAKLKEGSAAWNAWSSSLDYQVRRQIQITDSDLSGSNLQGAALMDIDFAGANLFETDLRNADLRGADLSKARGCLLARQFAGADLTGATLPEAIANAFDKLGSVSDISDSAKKLFLALLAACLYSWLTIATTKDVDLITNRASSPLPVIQTAIPIVGFYVVAPLILLCIYFYFHFYLQKLWEELATLPAVFTDGRPLYARADPWLFNDLVRAHFPRLKQGRPFLSYFQQWISILLAWWIVPVTLLLFWGRYLPRHDLIWTIVLALLLAISIVSAIRLYHLASSTLRGSRRLSLAETVRSRNPYVILTLVCLCSATFIIMSLGAVYGVPPGETDSHRSPRTWVPLAMSWLGYHPFANLDDADLSIKPPEWTGKKDDELDRIKGADLGRVDLRYASGMSAFLANARLSSGPPGSPYLTLGSDLSHANFALANLQHARLDRANLTGATLNYAHMEGAVLESADLSHAQLFRAHLDGAVLSDATLYQARLMVADLEGSTLTNANLREADIDNTSMINANLYGADLTGADLSGADLTSANLSGADLTDTKLLPDEPNPLEPAAEIKYADFRGTKGLKNDTIEKCRDWHLAFYDPDMLKQLGLPLDHNDALEAYRKSGSQEDFDSWQQKWRKEKEKSAAKPE